MMEITYSNNICCEIISHSEYLMMEIICLHQTSVKNKLKIFNEMTAASSNQS